MGPVGGGRGWLHFGAVQRTRIEQTIAVHSAGRQNKKGVFVGQLLTRNQNGTHTLAGARETHKQQKKRHLPRCR